MSQISDNNRTDSPWHRAASVPLIVEDNCYCTGQIELERGVNFFVQALHDLGCETHASCEGHPRGFYIVFTGPEEIARAIAGWGYFTVEVDRQRDTWVMRLCAKSSRTEASKRECLSRASECWEAGMSEWLCPCSLSKA
jgi:hypothetical protein